MSTGYDLLEDKELFEYLGRALYECQRLEVAFAYIIRDVRLVKGSIKGNDLLECLKEFQKILDSRLEDCTLGQLLSEFRTLCKLDDEDERLLRDAKGKRDEIVHHFTYKHWVAKIAPVGRDVMLNDLKQSIEIIHDAYKVSENIQKQLDAHMKSDNDYTDEEG
jgi:hypothetical protein